MNTALIVAAGMGVRSGLGQSKILFKVNDKPIFLYSVETFLKLGYKVILVVSKDDYDEIIPYVDDQVSLVIGGATRSQSVQNGLKLVDTPYVYIHDGARPMISKEKILMLQESLEFMDAVCLFEKVTPALKYFDGKHIESRNRSEHLLAQTPQAFLTEKIRYASLRNESSFDDDIALFQNFYPEDEIGVIINDEPNTKLTYYEDFVYFKKKIEGDVMRIGHSFDLHQLVENRPLILAGIKIDYEKGLLGHSDADVVCHAISEAFLGSLALGDLGTHFPDHDDQYKDMDSTIILKEVYQKIKDLGYRLINMDVMIYAEKPKLNPYIEDMVINISKILEVDANQISIKATTYEKMDAIGQGLAIASEATLLVKKV